MARGAAGRTGAGWFTGAWDAPGSTAECGEVTRRLPWRRDGESRDGKASAELSGNSMLLRAWRHFEGPREGEASWQGVVEDSGWDGEEPPVGMVRGGSQGLCCTGFRGGAARFRDGTTAPELSGKATAERLTAKA